MMHLDQLKINQLVTFDPSKDPESNSDSPLMNPLNLGIIRNITLNPLGEFIACVEFPIGQNKWRYKDVHLAHLTKFN